MSESNCLKRNNEEIDQENGDTGDGAPESKQMRIDVEISEHNLKDESVGINNAELGISELNEEETALNENEKCTETIIREQVEIPTESKVETLTEETQEIACNISIKFQNDAIAELYKSKFIQFVSSFPEFRVQDDNLTISLYTTEHEADTQEISPRKRRKRSRVKKELFVVDVTPSSSSLRNDLRYTTKFTINTEKFIEEAVQGAKATCFNCAGDHALKDCPHPKDRDKINEARQKFRVLSNNKAARYHLEPDQKFSHLQPGQISLRLRKALNLHKSEAPPYIYQMRQLGYPPGWLEEAKIVHSNLDMYIDGSVKSAPNVHEQGLDASKIIEFPGFNAPVQRGVKDDYRKYGVPPYSDKFSKQAMIDFFNQRFTQERDNFEATDKVIEREPDPSRTNPESDADGHRNSPTLTDLEQKKRQLLEELNEEPKKDPESDANREFLAVKASCFGTPVLKSSSPYSSLPDPDKFSKDVSPMINFENLPNSTGKYEQLNSVLDKVRTTMKKINSFNI